MSAVRLASLFVFMLLLASCAVQQVQQPVLDKKTAERVTQLRKEMLLHRARALVQYEPIYQELETLLPKDAGAADDINHYKSERNEIASHLFDCGTRSMAEKNYLQAEECLELSNQLLANAEKQILLDKVKLVRKQQEDRRHGEQIMLAYQLAYASGNLAEAHLQLDALQALQPENNQAVTLHQNLNAEIRSRMTKGLEEARSLYSQGKIAEALAICNGLMLIEPKNEELLAMISRAEKVNKNIEKLSKAKK